MIIKKSTRKPFVYVVVDDRKKLMDTYGPKGGYGKFLYADYKTRHGIVIAGTVIDYKNSTGDAIFDMFPHQPLKDAFWYCFKEIEHARVFDKEFGDSGQWMNNYYPKQYKKLDIVI